MGLLLDSSQERLTTPAFAIPGGGLTYAAWVKDPQFAATSGPRIFENTDVNTTTRWFFSSTGDLIFQRLFSTTTAYTATAAAMATANGGSVDWTQWNHVAVTHDGTRTNDAIFYINGEVAASSITTPGSGTTQNSQANIMTIGNRSAFDRQINGIDHPGIYNAVLSQANIQSLLTQAHHASNMYANWSFDSLEASYTDLSGNSRTATVQSTVTFLAGPSFSVDPTEVAVNFEAFATFQAQLRIRKYMPFLPYIDDTLAIAAGSGTPWEAILPSGRPVTLYIRRGLLRGVR